MTSNDSIVRMPTMTALPDINLEPLHQLAVVRVLEFRANVLEDMPDCDMTDEDLTSDEITKRRKYANTIVEQLNHCIKQENPFMILPPLSSLGSAMIDLRRLLNDAYERKKERVKKEKAQAEETAKQKVAIRKIEIAVKGIDPPFEEAKRQLSASEYQCFVESILKAADAYIDAQESSNAQQRAWLNDPKSWEYRGWCSRIQKRRDEELRRRKEEMEAERAKDMTILLRTAAVHKFQAELLKNMKPIFQYPIGSSPYYPDSLCKVVLPDETQIKDWAGLEIRKQIPATLTNCVRWDLTWEMAVLPKASYEVNDGIPSLRWNFVAQMLITANLELGECVIYDQHPGYSVIVQAQGQKLGTLFLPVNWALNGNFTTPIVLLHAFAKGQMEAQGITVVNRRPPLTIFSIEGTDDVEVSDSFRAFIRKITGKKPLWDSLLGIGIIDSITAQLLKGKWNHSQESTFPGSGAGEMKEKAVNKLMEMGWTEIDAKKAVAGVTVLPNYTVETIVKLIVGKPTGSY